LIRLPLKEANRLGAEQAEKTAQGLREKAERDLSVVEVSTSLSTFISARERRRLQNIPRTQERSEANAKAEVGSAFISQMHYMTKILIVRL